MIFVGIVTLAVATIFSDQDSTDFGAIIFIGPVPIMIGGGTEAGLLILAAAILTVVGIVVFLIMRKEEQKTNV